MTYQRFEELPVWKAAIDLGHGVFDAVRDRNFAPLGDLRNQLQRAVLSVSNNIAEGFERGTTNELLCYLYIARGSAGEVRSALHFAAGRTELSHQKSQISNLISQAENISKQIRGWANSLQNSPIEGQRRLTDASREDYDRRKRFTAFWDHLTEVRQRGENPPATDGLPDDE